MVLHCIFATPSDPFIPVIHSLNCMQTTMLAALLVKTLLIENANAVCLLCRSWAGIREAWLSCWMCTAMLHLTKASRQATGESGTA